MTAVLGVDPGAHGAIALVINGALTEVVDMPADQILVGKKQRLRVNAARLARQIQELASHIGTHVVIEKVGSQPKEGAASAFAFGNACGIVEGVVAALGLRYSMVTPQTWKKAMRCPKDKTAARRHACQLFPQMAEKFARVKDDGRSEASILALYGYQEGHHDDAADRRLAPDRKPGRRVQVAPVRRTRRILAA